MSTQPSQSLLNNGLPPDMTGMAKKTSDDQPTASDSNGNRQAEQTPALANSEPKTEESSGLAFPEAAYVGVAAKIAKLYAQHHEAPQEFVYMDLLTQTGTVLSGRWEADFGGLNTQPRLYTLKIAKSGWSRKSTATRFSEKVIKRAIGHSYPSGSLEHLADGAVAPLQVIYGVGSAEGLIGQFRHLVKARSGYKWVGNPRIVVSFDEFRRFEKKAGGESSVLLYAANELYDRNEYDNCTKGKTLSASNAHLGFIANTTDETYRELLDAGELEGVGFLNRVFHVVSGGQRRRVPRPRSIERELDPLAAELGELFKGLPPVEDDGRCLDPIRLKLTEEADHLWADYYIALPETKATARLDAMGPRLMGILAFVDGKREIDVGIVRTVITLLGYQHRVREVFQPIMGDTLDAKLEARIYQAYRHHGALTENECRRLANGYRVESRRWTAVFGQFQVRHLQRAAQRDGSRAERWELKPGAIRD